MSTQNKLTLSAPAKLNLFLHINSQRKDGYHNLQTLFQLIDLADILHFEPQSTLSLSILDTKNNNLSNKDNLILQAAEALNNYANTNYGAHITLEKNLPIGGGVGGGSSDAATTLLGLNRLWSLGLSINELATIGQKLGADVPVFVHGNSAFAEGIGEKLTPVELDQKHYLIVKPDAHVSTQKIFTSKQLTRDTPYFKIRPPFEMDCLQDFHNDCEPLVKKLYPNVAQVFRMLAKFGSTRLTGTGACVFVIFDEAIQAQHALNQLPKSVNAWVAKGLNVSLTHIELSK
ncbi:MAG: 4-(cytidine 5'-diphospho)-2-C-methyl-D-erythritol kinase [Saccharospirillaceae bacterium]|nr:4-(cytidine 5'-diphospho)-2-C-methyl-D-erythritol kinase [Pseudomonadales bacterium]NRB80894.1 4-(cytidine 5'-diphospho)-2-C-methyl-D-erythritol kinase [Saccharospirillaceae bacterium]